ncbi:hypothetical protein ACIBHX_48930 [Nonomuraea sp. NPDC050536]|uniref:hypothetical protein n=1 Tax=Nonomuraea sp. NPDC050536 TaxID=3364366 RepID=UPI0037CA6B0C
MYVLPCVKIVGEDWQAILIATTTGQRRYIGDFQQEWLFSGGSSQSVEAGLCGPLDNEQTSTHHIPPNTSVACFSPTVHSPNTLLEGEFQIFMESDAWGSGEQDADLYSPSAWTAR